MPARARSLWRLARWAATLAATAIFAVLALRGTGLGFVMIDGGAWSDRLGIAYRWISLTNGDNGHLDQRTAYPFALSSIGGRILLGRHSSCS